MSLLSVVVTGTGGAYAGPGEPAEVVGNIRKDGHSPAQCEAAARESLFNIY